MPIHCFLRLAILFHVTWAIPACTPCFDFSIFDPVLRSALILFVELVVVKIWNIPFGVHSSINFSTPTICTRNFLHLYLAICRSALLLDLCVVHVSFYGSFHSIMCIPLKSLVLICINSTTIPWSSPFVAILRFTSIHLHIIWVNENFIAQNFMSQCHNVTAHAKACNAMIGNWHGRSEA